MTELIREIDPLRARLALARERGLRVGVVPTMGALHRGHLALVAEARKRAQVVVVTVFVNPTQFGPNEDFTKYPRMLEKDVEACRAAGADLVFSPGDPQVIYPEGDETRVRVPTTAKHLEGEFRPHHFEGVATVCMKLFQIVGPSVAVFGRKDYQQLMVIREMVRQLNLPLGIVAGATLREADGLAMSSRNGYLSAAERMQAPQLQHELAAIVAAVRAGERDYAMLAVTAVRHLKMAGWRVDYIEVRDADTLAPPVPGSPRLVVLGAAWLGRTRLIDNLDVDLPGAAHV